MKLRLVEKKIIYEQQQSSILVKTDPSTFLKLTLPKDEFRLIRNFIESESYKELLNIDNQETRKKLLKKHGFQEKTGAMITILKALSFIKPTKDISGYGDFSEEKAGNVVIVIKTEGDISKVIHHEGRTRTIARWMIDPVVKINLEIIQDENGETFSGIRQFLNPITSQYDDTVKALKSEFSEISKTSNQYIFIDRSIDKENNQLIARTSSKIFEKNYTRMMILEYPNRIFFKLKSGHDAKIPKTKKELMNSYEIVKDPITELEVKSATGEQIDKLLNLMPDELNTWIDIK